MKATGIVRKIDELGRVVIPREIRKNFGLIESETTLEIFVDSDQQVILRKYEPGCVFCGQAEGVTAYKGKLVCPECAKGVGKVG